MTTGRAAVALLAALAGCAPPAEPPPPAPGPERGTVRDVTDGDTIVVDLDGRPGTRVRLLQIDAPERGECHARDATAYLERTVPPGSTVRVEADRDPRDRYGRDLLYVWSGDGTFVNEAAVREGHARAVLYAPNDRHIGRIRAAEADARRERRGLWRCPGAL